MIGMKKLAIGGIALATVATAGMLLAPLAISANDGGRGERPDERGEHRYYDEDGPPGRPRLSGDILTLDTDNFKVHYTLGGRDRVPSADADSNGIPDYVEQVGQAMEHARTVQVDQMGWAPPPTDGTEGGDARYDVYLLEMYEDEGGFTDAGEDNQIVGDNPLTTAVETRASTSYIGLASDYSELAEYISEMMEEPVTSQAVMQAVAAHEYNHAIQAGYDGREPEDWLWEATATWIEHQMFPDIPLEEEALAVVKSTDACPVSFEDNDYRDEEAWIIDEFKAYGLWVVLQHISEQHGPETVRAIWEQARTLDGYDAIDAALKNAGSSLEEAQRGFYTALLTRSIANGAEMPTVRLEGIASQGQVFTPETGVGSLGADYIGIEATGTVAVTLDSEGLDGRLVGIRDGNAHVIGMTDGQATLDTSAYSDLYLVATNPDRIAANGSCSMIDYTVDVQTNATGTATAVAQTLNVPNFTAPQVEGPFDAIGMLEDFEDFPFGDDEDYRHEGCDDEGIHDGDFGYWDDEDFGPEFWNEDEFDEDEFGHEFWNEDEFDEDEFGHEFWGDEDEFGGSFWDDGFFSNIWAVISDSDRDSVGMVMVYGENDRDDR